MVRPRQPQEGAVEDGPYQGEAARLAGQPGANVGQEVGEQVLASQCDLLIAGILHGFQDYADLPPIDDDADGVGARSLLRWALTGLVPDRYRAYALTGPLLARPDVTMFGAAARDLQAGSCGSDLATYGAALVALTRR